MYLWLTLQGWIQRAYLGEVPHHKRKKKEVFFFLDFHIVNVFYNDLFEVITINSISGKFFAVMWEVLSCNYKI